MGYSTSVRPRASALPAAESERRRRRTAAGSRDEELDGDGDGDGGEGEGVVEEVSLLMPFSTFPFGCFLACLFERGESDKV
jgi:hypothetical protein